MTNIVNNNKQGKTRWAMAGHPHCTNHSRTHWQKCIQFIVLWYA